MRHHLRWSRLPVKYSLRKRRSLWSRWKRHQTIGENPWPKELDVSNIRDPWEVLEQNKKGKKEKKE